MNPYPCLDFPEKKQRFNYKYVATPSSADLFPNSLILSLSQRVPLALRFFRNLLNLCCEEGLDSNGFYVLPVREKLFSLYSSLRL
jgi:hypothetical protein